MRDLLEFVKENRLLPIVALTSIVIVISGPFGTFGALALFERIIYWVPIILLATILAIILNHFLCRNRTLSGWENTKNRIIVALVFVAMFSPIVYFYNCIWRCRQESIVADFCSTVGMVGAATLVVTLISILLENREHSTDKSILPRLNTRLADPNSSVISHLTVNDHYVEVYFQNCVRERLLMRFGDAIAEMDGVPGVCTHRSYWVAEAAIVRKTKQGGRDVLELTCGTQVPISRRYHEKVSNFLARKVVMQ